MKTLVQRIYTNTKFSKALEWGRLVSITSLAQMAIQVVGLIGGIFIIRLLSTKEYALYTLANTMLGMMVLLADGGISTSVMAQGSKVWRERQRLGAVLITGFNLRKRFATGSLLIAMPILLMLLVRHGAEWVTAILIIASIIPSFYASQSDSLLEIAPKLNQNVSPMQKIQVEGNIGRLAFLSASLFLFPWAFVALFCSGISQCWMNLKMRKISSIYADWNQGDDPVVKRKIINFAKLILPGTIYYCVSGQITIWIVSFFGSTATLAQLGALGRLAMMLNIFSAIFNILIIPRFSRLPSDSKIVLTKFFHIVVCLLLISIAIISITWVFPSEILWVLGSKYSNLQSEVNLIMIGSCLNLFAGCFISLYTNRGWAINPIISISISISSIVLGVLLINVSSLTGIILFNLFVSLVQVLMHGIYILLHILRLRKDARPEDLLYR